MNVYNMNQSHGIHRMHTKINPLHHFVQGVVRRLSPADHNRALTHGTVGDLTLEAVNNERDALVQQVVQVRGDPRHLRHHPNLQPDNKFFLSPCSTTTKNTPFHLPKNGDPSYDGNGGSHLFGACSSAR